MDRLYEICDKHGITVVEDCAHALGVKWRGEQLGNRAKVRLDYHLLLCAALSCFVFELFGVGSDAHVSADVCNVIFFGSVASLQVLCIFVMKNATANGA